MTESAIAEKAARRSCTSNDAGRVGSAGDRARTSAEGHHEAARRPVSIERGEERETRRWRTPGASRCPEHADRSCRKISSPDFPIARALHRANWPESSGLPNGEATILAFDSKRAPRAVDARRRRAYTTLAMSATPTEHANGRRHVRVSTTRLRRLPGRGAPPLAARFVSARPPCISATRPPPTRPARTRLAPRATGKTRIAPRCADNNPGGTSPPAKTRPGRSPLS